MDRGGVGTQFHSFLILPLDRGEWLTLRPGRFTPAKQCRYPPNLKKGKHSYYYYYYYYYY